MKKIKTSVATGLLFASLTTLPCWASQDDIKIGVVTPLSGTYAAVGQPVRWGLELAAREINEAGGVAGRKLVLIFEDEEANPAVAVQKAERLIQLEKVDFLTGMVNSGSTLAVGQLGERNNKLVSTTVSFADSITGEKCSPNVFRVNARAEQQSNALTYWLGKEKAGARVFSVGPDYEMGRSSVAAFKAGSAKNKIENVGEVFAPLDSKDYSQYFGQLRATRPDTLYTSVAGNDAVRLLTQLDEFGILKGVQVVGSSGTITSQNIQAIGKASEGYVTGTGYSPKLDNPANKKFVESYRSSFKSDPDLFAADSYGLLYAYKAAVEKAGSTDTEKVREALSGLTWDTPQGSKTIRAGDHQASQPMYIVKVKGGQFDVIDQVPADKALGPDVCARF
jgi:branched-chain amino acid transport system substrate-binding protein